jgi:hypothetical protein
MCKNNYCIHVRIMLQSTHKDGKNIHMLYYITPGACIVYVCCTFSMCRMMLISSLRMCFYYIYIVFYGHTMTTVSNLCIYKETKTQKNNM